MAGKNFYDFEVQKGWLITLEEVLEKIPEEQQKEFLQWANAQYMEQNWQAYLNEIPNAILKDTVQAAIDVKAHSKRERTPVGVAFAMYDNEIFAGSNKENTLKKTVHAEQVAILDSENKGYHTTDFWFMVQVFKSGRKGEQTTIEEAYPCCLDCMSKMWDSTHPDLIILNATPQADVMYATKLGDLVMGYKQGPIRVYPSHELKKRYPGLMGSYKPKLGSKSPYYEKWYDEEGKALF